MDLEVGQELEFIRPATWEGKVIPDGTRVRVGAITTEFFEPMVTLVVLGGASPEGLTVAKHVVALNCRKIS
jgi:hypothetical protein